jgi:putative endopeptidase
MRLALLLLVPCCFLTAQDKPLTALPYTPSLEQSFMDKNVDPCVDFYKYSCGNWNKINPIPADQASWDVYGKLAFDNQRFLWGILEETSKQSPTRTTSEQKIGDFFHACMDEPAIQTQGAAPLAHALKDIEAIKSLRELATYVGKAHASGLAGGMLFGFGSDQDFDNSNNVIAFATAGGLGLPDRDYYVKTDAKSVETRQKYVAHVTRMFELLGDAPSVAAANARTVMSIETELAKASLKREEMRNPYNLKHKMTLPALAKLSPDFAWDAYLAELKAPAFTDLNVTEPKFYEELNKQLKQTSIDRWKSYLRWHLAHEYAGYLSYPFVMANFDFYSKYLTGVTALRPRWKRCVQWVDGYVGEALGQVFVAKTFGPETKQRAVDMTHEIQWAMEQDIQQLTWMGPATKQRALEKLHGMVDKIGYPEKWRDYSSVTITPSNFFGDVDSALSFETRRQLNKIGKPVDRSEWGMTPPTINAYYNAQMNDINFPAGVLQPPLFDPKLDDAPNYGNTGATIGHELTHGFDDEGRQFDAKGNLSDWWTEQDAKEFEKRATCVSDQASRHVVIDEIKINGKLTLGEDAADLGGTMLAYMAWKHATANKDLKPIDGLTPDQRFFVGMAQWACGYTRPETERMRAITDPHSPLDYRINGVVSNLPEFQQAFRCKSGQPMVNAPACRVW